MLFVHLFAMNDGISGRKRKSSEVEDARDSVNDSTNSMVSNVRIEDSHSNNSHNERPSKRAKVGVDDTNSTILNALRLPLMNGTAHKLPMPQFHTQLDVSRPEFSLISEALKAIPMPPLQK